MNVELVEGPPSELADLVRSSTIDIVYGPNLDAWSELRTWPRSSIRPVIAIAIATDHRLAGRESLQIDELQNEWLIVFDGDGGTIVL